MDLKELKNIKNPDVIRRFKEIKMSYELGISNASVKLNVSRTYLYKWRERYKLEGVKGLYERSKKHKSHPKKIDDEEKNKIIAFIKLNPELTYKEISQKLKEEGINRHDITICNLCKEMGIEKIKLKSELENKRIIKRNRKVISIITPEQNIIGSLADEKLNLIRKRILDTLKMRSVQFNLISNFDKRVDEIYQSCCFPIEGEKFGLSSKEEFYKDEIKKLIRQILKNNDKSLC